MTVRYMRQPAPPEPALRPASELQLASRLTDRDRRVLRLLWDHRVLTTPQIARLGFDSDSRARHRMLVLARYGAVERFRPLIPVGTLPLHFLIGKAGAQVLAAEAGQNLTEFGYRRERIIATAYSPQLSHLVGVNDLFTRLIATARTTANVALTAWWPEHRCARTWGAFVRPDAYGQWTQTDERGTEQACDWFLEHDTGTETLARVTAKLDRYADLAAATRITTPVLIRTSTPTREANLHRRLRNAPVPIATTTFTGPYEHASPADAIWLPAGGRMRLRLIDLARLNGPIPTTPPADDTDDGDTEGDDRDEPA